jgi:hypothetical protein
MGYNFPKFLHTYNINDSFSHFIVLWNKQHRSRNQTERIGLSYVGKKFLGAAFPRKII